MSEDARKYASELRDIAGMVAQTEDGPLRWKQYRLAAIADYLSAYQSEAPAQGEEEAVETAFSISKRRYEAKQVLALPLADREEGKEGNVRERVIHLLLDYKWSPKSSAEIKAEHETDECSGALWDKALAKADAILALSGSLPPSPVGEGVTTDVRRLVIAARMVAFDGDCDETKLRELDQASEAFADRVPWDDEPTPPTPAPVRGE